MLYATYLARTLSVNSIPGYLNIIRIMHEEYGFSNPLSNWELGIVKRGLQRCLGKPPKQKLAITPDILKKLHDALDFKKHLHVGFWAACLVGFFAFLRKSTLLPKSGSVRAAAYALCIKDVSYIDSTLIHLHIRHTKTIQFGQRTLVIPIAKANGCLCPVKAVTDLLARLGSVKVTSDQPLFSYLGADGKLTCLTHSSFLNLLKKTLITCGLNASDYSGHSFRRGGCTFSFKLGVSPLLIKLCGDWKSNAYERYVSIQEDQHNKFAKVLSMSV